MDKYDKWLNSPGSIMYYFVFSFIRDKDDSGVMADVRMRDNEVEDYTIMGNTDDKLVAGESTLNKVVINEDELETLNTLPLKHDLIKWFFSGKTYYHPLRRRNG